MSIYFFSEITNKPNHFRTKAQLMKDREADTSRRLVKPSQFNLSSLTWTRKSISGSQECHYPGTTSPPPDWSPQFWSATPGPLPLAQGSPKWFLLRRKSSVHRLVCEKIKDVWLLLSWWCNWRVEECRSRQTLGFSLWAAVNGCRDNIGLNPERNVSTGSVRGRHSVRVRTLLVRKKKTPKKPTHWRINNSENERNKIKQNNTYSTYTYAHSKIFWMWMNNIFF